MPRILTSRFPVRCRIPRPCLCHVAPGSRRGSALVISLVFIVLITIVLVGFVTTAGLERKTVQSHYGKVQADLFNSMAAGVVASRITQATTVATNASGPVGWWVSQPGRIAYTPFATTATAPATTFVDLSSGQADSPAVEDVSVDLNPASLTQGTGLAASDTAISLPVKWTYVRKDGSQTENGTAAPTYNSANPLVGRYAYWTDDESSRVNVNAAASRTAPQNEAVSHPSRIDLTTFSPLTASEDQALRAARNTRPFNSLEEIKAASTNSSIADAVSANKIALTHYNQSPELNRFGEPRIVLTTQEKYAPKDALGNTLKDANGTPYFLDILTTPNSDPGPVLNLDNPGLGAAYQHKIEKLFDKLYPYFNKRECDWGLPGPVTYNKTLAMKYTDPGVAQIILNLIDYVRSVETADPIVLPIRGCFPSRSSGGVLLPTTFTYNDGTGGANSNFGANGILGNPRRLHIVEIGLWLPPVTVFDVPGSYNYYDAKLKARIHLPASAGGSVNIVGLNLLYTIYPSVPSDFTFIGSNFNIAAANLTENGTMNPGEYRTITASVKVRVTSANARPSNPASIRLALRNNTAALSYDLAPVYASGALQDAAYTIDAPTVLEPAMTSISTNDPAINQCFADWTTQGANSFGTQNRTFASKLGQAAAAVVPQQDKDAGGLLTNAGTLPPAMKGSAANPLGIVGSPGEIGRVHSGGRGTSVTGMPWRSLRLQPRSGNGVVPDWMLLDLFTVPLVPKNSSDEAVLRPSTNTLGGRVNVNGRFYPFSTAQVTRNAPLRSIIRGLKPALTDTQAGALADNILNQTLAAGANPGVAFGPAAFTAEKLYPMTGQICEIMGLADSGEESEDLVRGLAGFLTAQSNVYSVFSVGQKIQQLPGGKIKVLGESRTRTLLERYEDTGAAWKTGGTWKVRVLSTTELGL
jgi:hypothetical protein